MNLQVSEDNMHNTGYKPHLTELAIRSSLSGFELYNDDEDGQQAAIIEGRIWEKW